MQANVSNELNAEFVYCYFSELVCCAKKSKYPFRFVSYACTPKITFFFFLSFNLLIVWQLSIWNCCKPFFTLLYNCQLLGFRQIALSEAVGVFPQLFFPDIAPSRMFTANSLCLIICPIHEWRLFFKIFKSNISYFAL
jgi:hypothetical protein